MNNSTPVPKHKQKDYTSWTDMVRSTAYRKKYKFLVDRILSHEVAKYLKFRILFSERQTHYMNNDHKFAVMPYNTAVVESRYTALQDVILALDTLHYNLKVAANA